MHIHSVHTHVRLRPRHTDIHGLLRLHRDVLLLFPVLHGCTGLGTGIYNMNVITVFRDPVGWSLDVVTRMATKMRWTATMISMVEKADVEIEGTRVLYYNDNGKQGSDKLHELRNALAKEPGCSECTLCAVWQKCSRLRKNTTMTGKRKRNANEAVGPAVQDQNPHPAFGFKCPVKMVGQRIANFWREQRT